MNSTTTSESRQPDTMQSHYRSLQHSFEYISPLMHQPRKTLNPITIRSSNIAAQNNMPWTQCLLHVNITEHP